MSVRKGLLMSTPTKILAKLILLVWAVHSYAYNGFPTLLSIIITTLLLSIWSHTHNQFSIIILGKSYHKVPIIVMTHLWLTCQFSLCHRKMLHSLNRWELPTSQATTIHFQFMFSITTSSWIIFMPLYEVCLWLIMIRFPCSICSIICVLILGSGTVSFEWLITNSSIFFEKLEIATIKG